MTKGLNTLTQRTLKPAGKSPIESPIDQLRQEEIRVMRLKGDLLAIEVEKAKRDPSLNISPLMPDAVDLLKNATYKPDSNERVCRGSFSLGTACGTCGRCKWERNRSKLI